MVKINLEIPKELNEALKKRRKENGQSVSWQIRVAIAEYLAKELEKDK